MKRTPLADRFWSKVEKSDDGDCWNWRGCRTNRGYGNIRHEGRLLRAHRVSWNEHYGTIPYGKVVCHHCDNRACVNPKHLFLGTQADNVQDAVKKGHMLGVRGERHGMAKLTDHKAREIVCLYATGTYTQMELARRFGVHHTNVSLIVRGKAWAH